MIYKDEHTIKKSDDRTITFLVDFTGGTGKSSFFKYLTVLDERNGLNQIGRSGYGTAQQLRSTLIHQDEKKIYIKKYLSKGYFRSSEKLSGTI